MPFCLLPVELLVVSTAHFRNIAGSEVSLLDVKNHQLLDYLINLTHLCLVKVSQQPIAENPSVSRLVELRTVSNVHTYLALFERLFEQ